MYQTRAHLAPSTDDRGLEPDVKAVLWKIFLDVGSFWRLTDDPQSYLQRFEAFIVDRIELNPLYLDFYRHAASYFNALVAQTGSEEHAIEILFTQKA